MSHSSQSGPFSFTTSRRVFSRDSRRPAPRCRCCQDFFRQATRAHAADAMSGAINVANPSFSRAERDRRWAAIRRIMAKLNGISTRFSRRNAAIQPILDI